MCVYPSLGHLTRHKCHKANNHTGFLHFSTRHRISSVTPSKTSCCPRAIWVCDGCDGLEGGGKENIKMTAPQTLHGLSRRHLFNMENDP
jgi:hypothetical protein